MIKSLAILILLSVSAFAGEALGVKYDQLYLVRLKVTKKYIEPKDLRVTDGRQPAVALEIFKVDDRWSKRIDNIFTDNADYDNGTADSRMQLYSLVFYKDGKVVLTITPNLLGSDLYASNKEWDHSLSGEQMDKFLQTAYFIMIRCEKSKLP